MMWVDTAKKYLGAFCAKDLNTMESLLSDNVSMTSWSCNTNNKEETLKSHRNFFDFADDIKVRIQNVAYKNSYTCLEVQMNYTIGTTEDNTIKFILSSLVQIMEFDTLGKIIAIRVYRMNKGETIQ